MHTRDDLPERAKLMREIDEGTRKVEEEERTTLQRRNAYGEVENRHTRRLNKALARRTAR